MARILYIQASPRGERSLSAAVADAFLSAYKDSHPEDEILTINLFSKPLPVLDSGPLRAKYNILHGQAPDAEDVTPWRPVEEVIEEFKSADKYVLATPMWNFSIPYRLKHYIDVIVQPTYTFRMNEQGGYEGLVTGKPVFIVCSRGGSYAPGSDAEAFDHQTGYLRTILGMIGLTDLQILLVEPTLARGPEAAAKVQSEAIARAEELAQSF